MRRGRDDQGQQAVVQRRESRRESELKKALATQTSSKLPWGKKRYFDRSRFDADLARLRAFYADRGYPDARVTSFDVKLNNEQDAVDLTVTISEGEPVTVAAVNFIGFDAIPAGPPLAP